MYAHAHVSTQSLHKRSRILTIYMGKPEIPVGKSNGLRYSIWDASENIGCDFRRCNFSTLFSLFSLFGCSLKLFILTGRRIL